MRGVVASSPAVTSSKSENAALKDSKVLLMRGTLRRLIVGVRGGESRAGRRGNSREAPDR